MPVNLSIKNAPDEMVKRLKERAERHHRSLQGELMAILEEAVCASRPLAPDDVLTEVRQLGGGRRATAGSGPDRSRVVALRGRQRLRQEDASPPRPA
jgi:antitoxin FitA